MVKVPGYDNVELLLKNQGCLFYKSHHLDTSEIHLFLAMEYPVNREILMIIQKEVEQQSKLKEQYRLNMKKMHVIDNEPIIVYEQYEGAILQQLMTKRGLSLEKKLKIAIALIKCIKNIEFENLQYLAIEPLNFIVKNDFSEGKFISLDLCYLLQQLIAGRKDFSPSLTPYISPEVTGRLNNTSTDIRSLIYSIGVILYELFTETKFINELNELEIIHSHLATLHEPAYLKNATIPITLSTILDLCLQKMPSDRYDSIDGIEQDLIECLAQLEFSGKIRPFELKKEAPKTSQIIKENIRSKEIEYIKELIAYRDTKQAQYIWVNGEKGVGKTYFIEDALKDLPHVLKVTAENGDFFVLKRIVDQLLQNIFMEDEEKLKQWRRTLLEIEEIESLLWLSPKLALIIGQIQDMTSNTYHYDALTSFLKLFMKKTEPLIIWIDNIEQIDGASKHYLSYLTIQSHLSNFIVIGSGDFEGKLFFKGELIRLQNLQLEELTQYFSPVLDGMGSFKEKMLHHFYKETKGNLKEIMGTLNKWVSEEVLFFSKSRNNWEWNEEKLAAQIENIEDTTHNRNMLKSPVNLTLSRAAVLQHPFTIQQLVDLTSQSEDELENILAEGVNKGFINYHHQLKTYDFNEISIKEQLEKQLAEKDRETLHVKASRLYGIKDDELYHKLYHANKVPSYYEKKDLISWNLQAGKAKSREKDIEKALNYIEVALSFINDNDWQENQKLSFNVLFEKAAILYASNHYTESKLLYNELLMKAKDEQQKISIYLALLQIEEVSGEYEQSFFLGKQLFHLLDFKINLMITDRQLKYRKLKIYQKMKMFDPSKLRKVPIDHNDRIHSLFKALYAMATISYRNGHKDWKQWVIMLVEETFKVGVAPQSAFGFIGYSIFLHLEKEITNVVLKWEEFSEQLVENHAELYIPVKTLLLLLSTNRRDKVDRDFIFLTRTIEGESLVHNNWWNKHYLLLNYRLLFQRSYPLPAITRYLIDGTVEWKEDDQTSFYMQKQIINDFLLLLMGKEVKQEQLQMNIEKFLAIKSPENHFYLVEQAYVVQYFFHYLQGNYRQAYKRINELIDQYDLHQFKSINVSYHLYYYFLIGYELMNIATSKEKKEILRKMKCYNNKLEKMSNRNTTLKHYYFAAHAILSSLLNKNSQAILYYEQAIEQANECGYLQDVGILSECYAKWNLRHHHKNKAKFYMNEAYHAYKEWGATIKVKEIESSFPTLVSNPNVSNIERADYHSIFLSTQAISQEIELPQLLNKLLNIMLQNAGGQYGALLMEQDGRWEIKAFGHVHSIQVETIKLTVGKHIVPEAIIQYVIRTKEELFLHNAQNSFFYKNEYVSKHRLKSVLCLPIMQQNKIVCVLYMENNLMNDAFTEKQLLVLKLLSSQCAISISNAKLFTDLNRLKENLERKVGERTESLQKSMEATTEALTEMTIYAERNRIAQEIHDIVGHTLTSTILQIEAGKRLVSKNVESALSRLQEAQNSVRHSLNEIRNSVHMLKEDKYYDLQEVMWALIEETERNTGVKVEANIDHVQSIPHITKKLLYHALQESITNGIKHGKSTYFRFTLQHLGNSIYFEMIDNGQGCDELQLGFGLKVMEERVQQLKGTLTLHSKLHEGYKLSIHLPL